MDLCTLDDVKQFYGIIGTDPDQDDLVENLITWVSKYFETYCNRTFGEANYTEYYDGGVDKIAMTNYPITVVSGVWDDDTWSWASSTSVSGIYYRIADNEREIIFRDTSLGDYSANVKVNYTAGYTTTTLPTDLKLACIEEVVRRFKRRLEVDVVGKTLEDGSSTLLAGEMLPQTMAVLDRHKRRRVV